MVIVERTVLQNTLPGHNKYYEICIVEDGEVDHYRVVCRWGRVESFKSDSAQQQVKASRVGISRARMIAENLEYKKSQKGYVCFSKGSSSKVAAKPAPAKLKAGAEPSLPDRTEIHKVPVEGDWWNEILSVDRVI